MTSSAPFPNAAAAENSLELRLAEPDLDSEEKTAWSTRQRVNNRELLEYAYDEMRRLEIKRELRLAREREEEEELEHARSIRAKRVESARADAAAEDQVTTNLIAAQKSRGDRARIIACVSANVKTMCKRCGRDGHSYAECSFDTYAAFVGGGSITVDLMPH